MNLTGTVYRPPYEANSLLLQATLGCSHNQCTFCYMYPDVQFTVCPMEQIEADLEEAAQQAPNARRTFGRVPGPRRRRLDFDTINHFRRNLLWKH